MEFISFGPLLQRPANSTRWHCDRVHRESGHAGEQIAQTTYETDYLTFGTGRLAGYSPVYSMSSADGVNYVTYIVTLVIFLGLASAEDLLPPQLLDGASLEIQYQLCNLQSPRRCWYRRYYNLKNKCYCFYQGLHARHRQLPV